MLGLEQTQVAVRSPYLDNDVVKMVYQAPRSWSPPTRKPGCGSSGRGTLPWPISARTAALAVLTALLTRGFLEFLFKAEYAYDYGMPQWVARLDHMFAPLHLERVWLGRHKVFHFRVWYRDELANYVREMLLDRRSLARPYLEPKAVQSIVDGHLRGGRNYTTEIHRLITLELTHRLFLDS